MKHNQKLSEVLTRVSDLVEAASQEMDFKEVFTLLQNFKQEEGEIKYDHSTKWTFFGVSLCMGIIFAWCYFLIPDLSWQLEGWMLIIIIVMLASGIIVPLVLIFAADDEINELSDRMFHKDILFDNGLAEQSLSEDAGEALYESLRRKFGDFRDRGDEERYIEKVVAGNHDGANGKYPFQYYSFHYVRVYYVPVTVSNGKTTSVVMQRQTETLHRYGLTGSFRGINGIAIISGGGSFDYPETWESASKQFNDVFSVHAADKMTAARFMQPAIVQAFVAIAKDFQAVNVEIDKEGEINISFEDDDVLEKGRSSSISDPEEFQKEIGSHLSLPKLVKVLQFMETLHQYNN